MSTDVSLFDGEFAPRVGGGSPATSPFDSIRHVRPDGSEFWRARELQPLMGYARWENFETPLTRAMQAAANTGVDVTSNFLRSQEITATKPREDVELSRYGAYLTAMNGDPNKSEVAAAQSYFAVRAREAETAPALPTDYETALVHLLGKVRENKALTARAVQAETAVRQLAPAATAWETFRSTGATLDVGTAAKYLARLGVKTGRTRLYGTLRGLGWVFLHSQEPTQRAVDTGYVEPEGGSTYLNGKTGLVEPAGPRTRLTAKGLERLAAEFGVALDHDLLVTYIAPANRQIGA